MPIDPARIEAVFDEAAALTDLSQRAAFLERACAGDPELRQEVEALIAAHETAGTFLKPTPDPETANTPRGTESTGSRIGRYKLLEIIGEGGMGVVYKAEQREPMHRLVALKLIKLGMDTRQVVARFESERQALALMSHPNVAAVHDAGATDTGRPYFVMELVQGVPITEYSDQQHLSIRDRLQLFEQVCQAVQHAHQKGLIHRDLKPTNILVSSIEQRPAVKVIDFGVAKATQSRLTEKTQFTEFRQMIGTPEYMSPEQAEGSLDIDTRSDVYSLGVLLYELLAGSPPFDPRELRSKAFAEMQRIIREVEPPTPSTRLSGHAQLASVAANRQLEPARLCRSLRGELDWIVMKALEKDRGRRYESVSALTADLEHYLADEPISAGAPSRVYRARKFIRRNRVAVLAVVAVASALSVGTVLATMGLVRARDEAARADRQATEARRQAELAEQRSKETLEVANFQAHQLQDIDVRAMGLGLRENIMEEFRAAMERNRVDPGELRAGQAQLEKLLDGMNLTNVALRQIDQDIFQRALQAVKEYDNQPLIKAQLLHTMAETLSTIGLSHRAVEPQAEAVSIRRRLLGDRDPATLRSIGALAVILQEDGRLSEAEPYAREALEKTRGLLGEEHRDTLRALNNMAHLLQAQGKSAEAEPLYRDGLEKSRRVLGDDDPATLFAINNVGYTLGVQGRFAEAEPFYREALERRRRVLGEDHAETLYSVHNMGFLLHSCGKFAEAEPYYREALEKRRRVLGEGHPSTLNTINCLGQLLQTTGKLAEAEPYLRDALQQRRRTLGEMHPDTLRSMNNVGYILKLQGKLAEAEPYYRAALDGKRQVLGSDHPDTLPSIINLGDLLMGQSRFDEAESLLLAGQQVAEARLATEHPVRVALVKNIVRLYESRSAAEPGEGYDAKAQQWKDQRAATRPVTR